MRDFVRNLRRQAEEQPMVALAVAGAMLTGVSKFLGAIVSVRNSRAWEREVARRAMKDLLK